VPVWYILPIIYLYFIHIIVYFIYIRSWPWRVNHVPKIYLYILVLMYSTSVRIYTIYVYAIIWAYSQQVPIITMIIIIIIAADTCMAVYYNPFVMRARPPNNKNIYKHHCTVLPDAVWILLGTQTFEVFIRLTVDLWPFTNT